MLPIRFRFWGIGKSLQRAQTVGSSNRLPLRMSAQLVVVSVIVGAVEVVVNRELPPRLRLLVEESVLHNLLE